MNIVKLFLERIFHYAYCLFIILVYKFTRMSVTCEFFIWDGSVIHN